MSKLDDDIRALEREANGINAQLLSLKRERQERDSREFIRINKITKDDVAEPEGYVRHVREFIEQMKRNGCSKRFAAWNGRLYFVSDLMAMTMFETGGLKEHVE